MNLILAIPPEFRMVGLFVIGVCAGGLINLGIYRLAWSPRMISPWSTPHDKAPARRFDDRMPIFGWLGLRREATLHGSGFWIRPLLIELAFGLGLAWLYWWEVVEQGLSRPGATTETSLVLHVRFAGHALLIGLMAVASFIDFDEKIIPDTVTVPGTLCGLTLAAVFPWVLLPGPAEYGFLHITSPLPFPAELMESGGLLVGLGCWWLWCFALMHRTWYTRHGWGRALKLSLARLGRESSTRYLAMLGAIGSVPIAAVWAWGPATHWMGLLTALVGMIGGAAIIWTVRIVGTAVLHREAMGFGDVTLMAMLGTLLGWQACLMVFFLAPFAGIVLGLINVVARRDSEIPFGPFLCLAALVVIARWAPFWLWAEPAFGLGGLIPAAVAVCMVLMAVMLGTWRLIREFAADIFAR